MMMTKDQTLKRKERVTERQREEKEKTKKQRADVYFNFIGNCQVPQKVDIEKKGLEMV